MATQILMDALKGETRLAVVEDDRLAEYMSERAEDMRHTGNIYLGRVENVLPGMNAAFVDIGVGKNGFLYAGDVRTNPRDFDFEQDPSEPAPEAPSITELARRGQELLVQVTKEAGGTKGPRLSCQIALPGRLAVLLPDKKSVGVSRKITDSTERSRLRDAVRPYLPEGCGAIVRTAAEGASEAEIARDIDALARMWDGIRRRAHTAKAPAMLCGTPTLAFRCVRDMIRPDVEKILCEGEALYRETLSCAELLAPEVKDRICLYDAALPLMDAYRVTSQLKKAYSRKVWLNSGGFLVFDAAEALTAIDVNTGKYTGKASLDETVFKLNCEAAVEIARQLRLRDIGGIIVVDFIDMASEEHNARLTQVFRQALKQDRSRINLIGLTPLGLMELTRKRHSLSLNGAATVPCPDCQGSGVVFSHEQVARFALEEVRARAAAGQSAAYLIECAPPVAAELVRLGGLPDVHAYVRGKGAFRCDAYEISPASPDCPPENARELI